MSMDVVSDGLNKIMNAKRSGKQEVTLKHYSKVLLGVLAIAKIKDYIKNYKVDGKELKIEIGKLNYCKSIKPRFLVKVEEIEKYVRRYLPARDMGVVIISTSQGLMTNNTAYEKNMGGSLIAYLYQMRQKISEEVAIPEGVECGFSERVLKCKKGNTELAREINLPDIKIKIESGKMTFECSSGNKNDYKLIKTQVAHVNNMLRGLNGKYSVKMQAVNVHFPMTLKVEGNKLVISNFLGEKVKRSAEILPGVDVQIKGQEVIVSSGDIELAGKTAANIEKATKIPGKDRRVFQDGVFIVEKGWVLK